MTIEDLRDRIDEIDRGLVELLNERFRCVIEIGRVKRTLNMRVYDPQREREVFENVKRHNGGFLDEEALCRLFERVIDECRRVERIASENE